MELGIVAIGIILALFAWGAQTRRVVDDHVDAAIAAGDSVAVVGWGCGGVLMIGIVGLLAFALAFVVIGSGT